MQDNPTSAVTMTAACELGAHRCGGVVLTLTGESWDAQSPCSCPCHSDPAPVDPEEELERIQDLEADRLPSWDFS
jgi:hypothetical protein